MDDQYAIIYVDNPEQSVWGILGQGIHNYNMQAAGDAKGQRICFALQAPDESIAGGVLGVIYWDWLYVDLMWIKEEQRGCGYGSRLLALIEDEARQRGARHAFLDTFSFQAPDFYKKHGYRVFGELADFPAGQTRYFLTKELDRDR